MEGVTGLDLERAPSGEIIGVEFTDPRSPRFLSIDPSVQITQVGPNRTLLWLPDIDRFEADALPALLDGVDDALIDGTFLGPEELPGRDLGEIPHPFMNETLDRLAALGPATRISFVHLNHSNPLILPDSDAGREFEARFRDAGLTPAGRSAVAADGEEIAL